MGIGRACRVCGIRIDGPYSRCDNCRGKAFARRTSCTVCGVLSDKSYCEVHLAEYIAAKQQRSQSEREAAQPWRSKYRDPAYHRERQAVLKRAAGRCERCRRTDLPLQVDHLVPLSQGGTNERANLWALCTYCHKQKTAHDRRTR
jgi:5-methylcytosine-specific restriction protein A